MTKKKRRKPGRYKATLLDADYYFFTGWSEEEFVEYCIKEYNYKPQIDNYTGLHLSVMKNKAIHNLIWVEAKRGIRLYKDLAHECVHAAVDTITYYDIKIERHNHEILAYLVDVLMSKALESHEANR